MKQEPDEDDYYSDGGEKSPEDNPNIRRRSHARSLRAMANPSAVWGHFDLCPNDPLRAQCRLCGAVVVRGGANPRQCGTTNLHRHLRVHHGGRLIGRRYHVMPNAQTSQPRPLGIASQPVLRPQMRSLAAAPSQQRTAAKTVVVKTIPLKMKQVGPSNMKLLTKQRIQVPRNATQPSAEVCLRWNSYHSNMQTSFPSLLDSEEFVDVTLACEGKSIKCHKIILSTCSEYLATLLRENPCSHPIILMKDLKFWEVEALVKFMYRGEVNVAHDKLPQLLTAAEALQVKGLAGPTPSPTQPLPKLVPQSRLQTSTPASPSSIPDIKEAKTSTSIPKQQSSPKRGTKRPMEPRPFPKMRIQCPKPPPPRTTSPTIKLEPLDIPLSDTDLFPETHDDSSTPNYENLITMHEADDPGPDSADGDIQFEFHGSEDITDVEEQMEFVPTDFLEQEHDADSSRNSLMEIKSDPQNEPIDDEDDEHNDDDDDEDDDEDEDDGNANVDSKDKLN